MKKQFVTDMNGKNIAVLIPLNEYNKMLDELDELNCIRAYDKVKSKKSKKFISASTMFKLIEQKRKPA